MKSRVIELQEKANQLLELAQAMDRRVLMSEIIANDMKGHFDTLNLKWTNNADTQKRASKRLWSAYLQVLTEIKLEL